MALADGLKLRPLNRDVRLYPATRARFGSTIRGAIYRMALHLQLPLEPKKAV